MSSKVPETLSPPETKVRKTRASKPKVKTGCQTCKIRRVKCDETKPACLRCVKFGHQCDGYISKHTSKPMQSGGPGIGSSNNRVLVPKAAGSNGGDGMESVNPYSPGSTTERSSSTSSPVIESSSLQQRLTMPRLCPAPPPRASPPMIYQHSHSSKKNTKAHYVHPSFQTLSYSNHITNSSANTHPYAPTSNVTHSNHAHDTGKSAKSNYSNAAAAAAAAAAARQQPEPEPDSYAFNGFCAATLPPASAACSVSRHAWATLIAQACQESEDISRAVVLLGRMGDSPSLSHQRECGWSSVGSLRHFGAWRGYERAESKWRRFYGRDEDLCGLWDQGYGKDVLVGLKRLGEWVYGKKLLLGRARSGNEKQEMLVLDLVERLRFRALLYALKVVCAEREDDGSGSDEMET